MLKIFTYLTFNGNCREAMTFYQHCFGGDLTFQNLDTTPDCKVSNRRISSVIVHASLESDKIAIMGTDLVGEEGLTHGNAISLLIASESTEEIYEYYEMLSKRGMAKYPPTRNIHGNLFAGLTDRFGTSWLLSEKIKHKK